MIAAWLLYEIVCRSPLGTSEAGLALFLYILLAGLTYAFAQTFSGRGTFIQIGALIGTIMVANVFVVIMPNQRKTVARLIAKKAPDPAWGEQAKQRSVHNNYLTLPVIFLMMGTHYPLFYATKYNWLIVAIVLAIGPLMRVFFNFRHANEGADWKKSPWWTWVVVALGVIAIGWLSGLGLRDNQRSEMPPAPKFAAVENIMQSRCSMCHAAEPVWLGIVKAPHDVLLDTPENIRKFAHLIEIHAVRSSAMPPGNITRNNAGRASFDRRLAKRRASPRMSDMKKYPRDLVGYGRTPARSALAGRRACRGAVRRQLRGRRREQYPARRRRVRSLSVRCAGRAAMAGQAAHEYRIDVRIRFARRASGGCGGCSPSATCR